MLKLFQEFLITNAESPKKRRNMFVLFMPLDTTFKTSLMGNGVMSS